MLKGEYVALRPLTGADFEPWYRLMAENVEVSRRDAYADAVQMGILRREWASGHLEHEKPSRIAERGAGPDKCSPRLRSNEHDYRKRRPFYLS